MKRVRGTRATELRRAGLCWKWTSAGYPPDRSRRRSQGAVVRHRPSLHLSQGPILRAVLFRLPPGAGDRLLLIAHHLVVDGVSWRILLEGLESAYWQLAGGANTPSLPTKTASFQRWSEGLVEYARSAAVARELVYWTAPGRERAPRLPLDRPEGVNTEGSADSLLTTLGPSLTHSLLRETSQAYRTEVQDLLLAALVRTFQRWTGLPRLLVDLEGHGREDEIVPGVDLSDTVGWFTSLYPVLLDLSGAAGPEGAIKGVKEQMRAVPKRGIGHGVLRYLGTGSADSERLRNLPTSEVTFEYMGRLDRALPGSSLFSPATEDSGAAADPRSPRQYLIAVWTGVVDDESPGLLDLQPQPARARHSRDAREVVPAGPRRIDRALHGSGSRGVHPCGFPARRYRPADVGPARRPDRTGEGGGSLPLERHAAGIAVPYAPRSRRGDVRRPALVRCRGGARQGGLERGLAAPRHAPHDPAHRVFLGGAGRSTPGGLPGPGRPDRLAGLGGAQHRRAGHTLG